MQGENAVSNSSSNKNTRATVCYQMETASDAVVVGGGPVGCFAGWNLARQGIKTTVFEEHPEVGVPSHCAGHLSIRSLKNLGLYPLPDGIVENTFSGANFYSATGTKFSVRLKKPVTCAINRALFDRFLAHKAEEAGASFHLGSRVQSLILSNEVASGVIWEKEGSQEARTSARIIVDAEGISSRLLRQAGLASLNSRRLVYAVQAEVENAENVVMDEVEVYLGNEYAPGFYGWLIPRPNGTAKVGLGTKTGSPKENLQRLMRKHPVASKQLGKAKVTRIAFHPITLGGPVTKTYADGFLAAGDVASQVKPTTGGGVIFGLTCARIAAEVAAEAIRKDDTSSAFLKTYQERCTDALGFDFGVMLRARRFLDSLSDEKIDEALRFAARFGLDKSLGDVDEIDFQGRTLMKMLTKPSAFAGLAYFLLVYLTANP